MNKLCSFLLIIPIFCLVVAASAENGKPGSISGRLMITDSSPMANAQVFIFNESSGAPPSFDRYWRVPDMVVQADSEGRFKAVLTSGRYYLGAIKRKSGDEVGPLQEGDLFLPFMDNQKSIIYTITNGSSADIGTISGVKLFTKSLLKTGSGVTAIEGTVMDLLGNPVENALVFAFLSPAMVGKPLFISEKTSKDGKYLLRVNTGGSYYLKIRNSYGGGAMNPGEIMGRYGEETPLAVKVSPGAITKGINITGIAFTRQAPGEKQLQ
jgi:hypothetical protein